jgi:hypothetical protein
MLKRYVTFIGILIMLLVIGFQMTWIYTAKKGMEDMDSSSGQNTSETAQADASLNQNVIQKNAEVVIESYDKDGMLIDREVTSPNADIVGKNRLELMVYANEYRENAPDNEIEQGLERMVVQSFSSDYLTLVKYYGVPIQEPGYWIAVRDNVVIVYTEDWSEVYEFTNIELWQLPQEVQYDLVDGIYVENERELFDFLQTYSS